MAENLNFDEVSKKLKKFIRRHKTAFKDLPSRHTAVLEIAALAMAAEHYRIVGYEVVPQNLTRNKFRVKTGASGFPKNFSWFSCKKGDLEIEVHGNLPVNGAHKDQGIYVVDVAVAIAGEAAKINAATSKFEMLSKDKKNKNICAVANHKLLTFMEVKKLVIYPMLLAQFVGIVHEIKPECISGRLPDNFVGERHFFPCLATTGYLTKNASRIIKGYARRSMKIRIAPNFENLFISLKDRTTESPLLISEDQKTDDISF